MGTTVQLEPVPVDLSSFAPATPTPEAAIIQALRGIGQLDGLADSEYEWLARHGTERVGDTGALVFREGEPGDPHEHHASG